MANVIPVLSEIEFRKETSFKKPSKWINPNANQDYVHIAYNFVDVSDDQTYCNTEYRATEIIFCLEKQPEAKIQYNAQENLMLISDIDFGIKAKTITIEPKDNGVIKGFGEIRSLVFASKYGEIKDEVANSSAALIKMISPTSDNNNKGVICISNSKYYGNNPHEQTVLTGETGILRNLDLRCQGLSSSAELTWSYDPIDIIHIQNTNDTVWNMEENTWKAEIGNVGGNDKAKTWYIHVYVNVTEENFNNMQGTIICSIQGLESLQNYEVTITKNQLYYQSGYKMYYYAQNIDLDIAEAINYSFSSNLKTAAFPEIKITEKQWRKILFNLIENI